MALLLLFGSSLGQVAHFVAVQHAICAEHGELVELHDDHADSEVGHGSDHGDDEPGQPPGEDDHDHCEQLARGDRELATLTAPAVGIAPATPSQDIAVPPAACVGSASQPLLALAPKTSPPRHAAVG